MEHFEKHITICVKNLSHSSPHIHPCTLTYICTDMYPALFSGYIYTVNEHFIQPTTSWTNCYHLLLPLKQCWQRELGPKYEQIFIFPEEWSWWLGASLVTPRPQVRLEVGWGAVGQKIPDWATLHPRASGRFFSSPIFPSLWGGQTIHQQMVYNAHQVP